MKVFLRVPHTTHSPFFMGRLVLVYSMRTSLVSVRIWHLAQ